MLPRLIPALPLLFGLALSGCALSPQELSPQPKLTAPLVAVGQGQPVQVRVVDQRPSPLLGTRGGIYPETSSISVPADKLMPRLQAEVETAVRLLGFTPTAGAPNAAQLTVTLVELKYQSPKDSSYVTEADITSILRADIQNGNRRYSGRYAASTNQRFGMAPNQQTNTELVSKVLSNALTRLFSDPSIGKGLLP
jgi:uncharacterized lipoprotein